MRRLFLLIAASLLFFCATGLAQTLPAGFTTSIIGSDWNLPDRKSTRLNSSHTEISTLPLHDALPIFLLIAASLLFFCATGLAQTLPAGFTTSIIGSDWNL